MLAPRVVFLATALLVACATKPKEEPPRREAREIEDAAKQVTTAGTRPPAVVRGQITTETLEERETRIVLTELPKPFASKSARKGPNVIDIPKDPVLRVPRGFTVNLYAKDLDRPRWLALTPSGDVLVTETRKNRIRLLADRDGDGVAEVRSTFADARNGVEIPFGMAFADNGFFLANTAEILRYDYAEEQTSLKGRGKRITELTPGGYRQHWTRNVIASPAGDKLYFSIGSKTNVEEEPLPRAAVSVMNLDGSGRIVFAHGLRNPVGLDFHPTSGELYVTVNERDQLGDDLVPDFMTRVRRDEFFGWPYAYLSPGNLDPRRMNGRVSERPELAAKTITPDVLFQAHSASLGLQFYDGKTFPARYQGGAFVAFRGSWNRSAGTGYKIVFIPFDDKHRPLGSYRDFMTGFLVDPSGPTTWGRPVGLLVLPDGSLLVTEEANGRIYRIQASG